MLNYEKKRSPDILSNLLKNRKGLSGVIVTLLLILLSITAAGIVWVVVSNIIQSGTEQINVDEFLLDIGIKTAYIDGDEIKVSVRRGTGGGEVTGVNFVFSDNLNSIVIQRNIFLNELEERTFTFTAEEIQGIVEGDSVSVAPVYQSTGGEQRGDVTDTEIILAAPPFFGEENGGDGNETGGGGGEEPEPPSCNGVWDGEAEDNGVECDGGTHCSELCTCTIGFVPDEVGGCLLEPSVNTGTIASIWPLGAQKYFDSDDLPLNSNTILGFIGMYANFSGQGGESRCLRVSYAEYVAEYNQSYVRLELVADILAGDTYEIWKNDLCGDSS